MTQRGSCTGNYTKWLVVLMCLWPLSTQAEWLTQVRQLETRVGIYKTETLIALQSEALWYYAWQIEGIELSDVVQHLHEYVMHFDQVYVQKNDLAWEQSGVMNPCSLRIRKVEASTAFLSLRCMRSQQPVHQPLLRDPALQLLWAWSETLAGGVIEHQWYSVQEGVAPQSLLLTLVRENFPAMKIDAGQHVLSFEKDAEQWLLTWLQMGEQVGVYVLRWR